MAEETVHKKIIPHQLDPAVYQELEHIVGTEWIAQDRAVLETYSKLSLDAEGFLKKYHKLWSAEIGLELNMGMKFRKLFKNLSDKQIDKYIVKFQNPKITDIIAKYGDIDYPSKLAKPLLKKAPTLLKLIPNMIKE